MALPKEKYWEWRMTKDEALKLALEALEISDTCADDCKCTRKNAITAIKQALAAPVQEPVAWATAVGSYAHISWGKDRPDYPIRYEVPLYTAPPAQPAPVQEPVAIGWDTKTDTPIMGYTTPPAQPVPVQEPVAVCHDDGYWTPLKTEAGRRFNDLLNKAGSRINVYTTPPQHSGNGLG
jgi:hypothetical protein